MDQWQERKRPVCLERRYEFDSHGATRDFDALGNTAKRPAFSGHQLRSHLREHHTPPGCG